MNRKTIPVKSADELIAELLSELKSINVDIASFMERLSSGLTDEKLIRTNLRYLDEALEQKDHIMEALEIIYLENISLETLMFDIQNN